MVLQDVPTIPLSFLGPWRKAKPGRFREKESREQRRFPID